MKRKWILISASVLIAFAGVFSILRQTSRQSEQNLNLQNEEEDRKELITQENRPSSVESPTTEAHRVDESHKKEVQEGLETIFEGLRRMGALQKVSTAMKTLSDAIASGDSRVIHRAFHEVTYGRFVKMSESIPAMKTYLDAPEPYVRYLAAEALLRVGDQGGVETLIDMISNEKPILYKLYKESYDLRFTAAAALAKYNVKDAGDSIRDLYAKTKNGELLRSLSELGLKISDTDDLPYFESRLAIERYAKTDSIEHIEKIKETFDDPKVPEIYVEKTKAAAAWALARMTGNGKYINFLSESARTAIESNAEEGLTYNDSTKAIKYLGSVRSPQAVEVLEAALESQNPIAVQYATVNLLFNQPNGSPKAERLVLDEFRSSPKMLGTELAMQIASKSSSSEIREAAKVYARRTGSDRWRYWGKERSDWPIENWVYDYVVTLNP